MKKLCVIGTGYVGLVGAAIFADWGNLVVGVDIDKAKIDQIIKGVMPIYEPGLESIVLSNIKAKRLKFTTSLKEGLEHAEIVFICVGTPQNEHGQADLSYVWQVAKDVAGLIKPSDPYRVIVTKSTVPVGTNELVKKIILEHAPAGVDFDVASNPEFLAEGSSVSDMRNTNRTVYGSDSTRALKVLHDLYAHLDSPIVECDLRTSEMIKYASNAMLATRISFINEIGHLCERAGANVEKVAYGMGLDKRIGPSFLKVSIGYGGSCFPKDVAALYRTSADQAYDFKLLRAVMEVNEQQKDFFVKKIRFYFGENLTAKTIAVLGLAFKENTDDIRESAAIKICRDLRGRGANLRVFDPEAMENSKKDLGDNCIYYAKDAYDAAKGADAVCILTSWDVFATLDVAQLKSNMADPAKAAIFDGRNLLNQQEVEDQKIDYFALGKPTTGLTKIKRKEPTHVFSAILNR